MLLLLIFWSGIVFGFDEGMNRLRAASRLLERVRGCLSRIKLYSDVDIEMEIESGIATHNLVRSWHGCQPLVRDTFLDEEYVRKLEIEIMSIFISRSKNELILGGKSSSSDQCR